MAPAADKLRAVALALEVLVASGSVPARGEEGGRPFVPSFWNPDAPPEKPDLDGIGTVRFLTSDDAPPFGFAGANGKVAGFDVDLARALCDELQLTCTIQACPWDAILPGLEAGQGDAAIASIAISDEARRAVDFTAPYFKTPARFVMLQASVLSAANPATLAGKRVGVLAGTAHEAYLGLFFPKVIQSVYPSMTQARDALRSGAVDAVFGDAVAWSIWLNGSDAAGCCAFAGGAYTESRFFGPGAGIAVHKGDARLRQALDYALARISAKGVYGDLYLKYFPVGLY